MLKKILFIVTTILVSAYSSSTPLVYTFNAAGGKLYSDGQAVDGGNQDSFSGQFSILLDFDNPYQTTNENWSSDSPIDSSSRTEYLYHHVKLLSVSTVRGLKETFSLDDTTHQNSGYLKRMVYKKHFWNNPIDDLDAEGYYVWAEMSTLTFIQDGVNHTAGIDEHRSGDEDIRMTEGVSMSLFSPNNWDADTLTFQVASFNSTMTLDEYLQTVPEPSTIALMLSGFLLMSFTNLRKKIR